MCLLCHTQPASSEISPVDKLGTVGALVVTVTVWCENSVSLCECEYWPAVYVSVVIGLQLTVRYSNRAVTVGGLP